MKNTKLLLVGAATIIAGVGLSFYNTNFAITVAIGAALCAIGLMMVGVAIIDYLEEYEE
jgi:hypothetical protein